LEKYPDIKKVFEENREKVKLAISDFIEQERRVSIFRVIQTDEGIN